MRNTVLLAGLLALSGVPLSSWAAGHLHPHGQPPACEPGYTVVEEVTYQEVVKKVCREVTETKKKWVYDTRSEDYCRYRCACPIHLGHHHQGCPTCESCKECGKPCTRCQLVKKQVDDCPTTKCVVEYVVEKVPCITYRKVPCGAPVAPAGRPFVEPIPLPKVSPRAVLMPPEEEAPAAAAKK